MKLLRDILTEKTTKTQKTNDLGGYKPKSPDEQKFAQKHKIEVTSDANGNGDEVFKASNVKTYDRTPTHGYNPGEDEKVYEDYIEEKAPPGSKAERFIKQNKQKFKERYGKKGEEVLYATAWKMFGKKGK